MQIRKNVLLLFSKYPHPGLVKTRLSTLKDGVFTPADAAELYEAMLLDVIGICMGAFAELSRSEDATNIDTYELAISCPSEDDSRLMKALVESTAPKARWTYPVKYIVDTGKSFDEHYNCAFEQMWEDGADIILSMGADMPALTVKDVVRGFSTLQSIEENENKGGIVIAPDQEMGVSIVGWTRDTDFDHSGVFYNKNGLTVLPAYIAKARHGQIPAYYLPAVPDVDSMRDLMHNITLIEALRYCSEFDCNATAERTWAKIVDLGIDEVRIMPNDLHDPRDGIDI